MNDLSLANPDLLALMRTALDRGAPFRFRALGASMTPFIREGDVLTITPLRSGEPRLGQVLAFVHPESSLLLVHRLVAFHGRLYLLQGDNSSGHSDGLVPTENLLGVVTGVKRAGRIVRFGLGPERRLIAFLSRSGLLFRLLIPLKALNYTIRTRRRF